MRARREAAENIGAAPEVWHPNRKSLRSGRRSEHRADDLVIAPVGASAGDPHLSLVFDCYRGPPSRSAQARATAELGVSLAAVVAQPAFSMIASRSQGLALLNAANFAVALA